VVGTVRQFTHLNKLPQIGLGHQWEPIGMKKVPQEMQPEIAKGLEVGLKFLAHFPQSVHRPMRVAFFQGFGPLVLQAPPFG